MVGAWWLLRKLRQEDADFKTPDRLKRISFLTSVYI